MGYFSRSVIFHDLDTDNLPYEKVGKNEPVCIADEVHLRFRNLGNGCD